MSFGKKTRSIDLPGEKALTGSGLSSFANFHAFGFS